jgi:predicted metal-binding protein
MNKSTDSMCSKIQSTNREVLSSCTLHVCTSCRTLGTSGGRSGFVLYKKLRDVVIECGLEYRVEVTAAKCLSICSRPCGLAISSFGSWTYLFGDQQADKESEEIIDCILLYLKSPDGYMARENRPKSLRSSILGRVPPFSGDRTCT